MKRLILALCLLSLSSSVWADFVAGYRAYKNSDFDIALREWLPLALEQGDANAQFYLGEIYSGGMGVIRADVQAVKWYLTAARQGHARAQSRLGDMYDRGWGVDQSYAKAFAWRLKAAEQGDIQAQYKLGFLYANGQGTARNHVQAYKWWSIATVWGDPDAAHERDKIAQHMSKERVARIQKLADVWRPKNQRR